MQCNGFRCAGTSERAFTRALPVWQLGAGELQRQMASGVSAYCYSLGSAAPRHVSTATQVLYLQTFLNCIPFSR